MPVRDPQRRPRPRGTRLRPVARGLAAVAAIALVACAPGNRTTTHASNPPDAMTATDRKPNHLADEKSPYLLQHAYNPVDWYPWGDAAFEKARREDKPIFLSIGYSTCHWCHVMEHESFENDSVAELLNRWFVPVKVDREERPDVDRVYMTSMNAMGMGGGWPLNVFLTPDLRPFYGGTYFPPDARMGRPGMLQMLPRVHEAWTTQRASLEDMGARVFDALAGLAAPSEDGAVTDALFDTCYAQLASARDPELGGFGRAPKFPSISNLNFMVRYWARDPAAHGDALQIALDQLDAMRAGGIHDQIGGGFHRYSTDREWLVPHFEKMLYDQAQIAWAYLDAYRITKRDAYAATARGIFGYVARDLTSPEGAFWSAEDADSEGEEGRFYVWTPAGLDAAFGGDDARLFAYRFGVTDAGNFEHGTSILHEAHTLEETAARFSLDPAEVSRRLDRAATKLLEVRAKRPRPHRDDKVLASWNGLMISALARGARTLEDPELARRAERAAAFIWDRLRDPATGALARRWRDGETAGPGQLDDYAYTALGFTDLYAATFDPLWLERAAAVTEAMVDRFWDGKDGAFFDSPAADPHLQIRMKERFDGAEMAGNSIAAYNLLSLASLLDRDAWRDKAQRTLAHYAGRIAEQPAAMPQMLVAMDLARSVPRHVVIAGDPASSGTRAMLRAFDTRFLPHDALLLVDGGARQRRLEALVPFTGALERKDGRATAYVCVNYACRLPTEDPAVFATQLDEGGTAAPGER